MEYTEAARRAIGSALRAGKISKLTARRYRTDNALAAAVFGNPNIRQLRRQDVDAFIDQPELAAASRRARLSAVRFVIRWALDQGHLAVDPTVGIRPPRPPRAAPRRLQTDEVARLFTDCDQRMRLILSLMVQEGLRCVEVTRLQVEDIDKQRQTILVRGKGDHERVLPVTSETWDAMQAWLACSARRSGPVIGLRPDYVSALVARHMKDCGIHAPRDGKSAHALRHTAASDVLEGGADLRTVSQMLGHRSVVVTERYTDGVPVELRAAMAGRRYAV